MKNFLFFILGFVVVTTNATAQTKTAYIDLYQRGAAQHLRTTIIYDCNPIYVGKKNIGEMLNFLSEKGWVVEHTMVIPRHPWGSLPATRHKFHMIMKKEYQEGENPFEGLDRQKIAEILTIEKTEAQTTKKLSLKNKAKELLEKNCLTIQDLTSTNDALMALSQYIEYIDSIEEINYAKEKLSFIVKTASSCNAFDTNITTLLNNIRKELTKTEQNL